MALLSTSTHKRNIVSVNVYLNLWAMDTTAFQKGKHWCHMQWWCHRKYLCLLLLGRYMSSFSPEWSSVKMSLVTDLQVVLEKFSSIKLFLTEILKFSCLFHLGCFWTKVCRMLEYRAQPAEMQPRQCSTEVQSIYLCTTEYVHRYILNK